MRTIFIVFFVALATLAMGQRPEEMVVERCMKYADDNGGDCFEAESLTFDVRTNTLIIIRWEVAGVAKPTAAMLPTIPATTNWMATIYPDKLKDKYKVKTDWDAEVEALREIIRDKWNWTEAEMDQKIKEKLDINKLKKKEKDKDKNK